MKIKKRGFGLIEITIGVAIIGTLATVITPKVKVKLNEAKVTKVTTHLDSSRSFVKIKYSSNYEYPSITELESSDDYNITPTLAFSFNGVSYKASTKIVASRDNTGGWVYDKVTGQLYANLPDGAYTHDSEHEIWGGEVSSNIPQRINHDNFQVSNNVPYTAMSNPNPTAPHIDINNNGADINQQVHGKVGEIPSKNDLGNPPKFVGSDPVKGVSPKVTSTVPTTKTPAQQNPPKTWPTQKEMSGIYFPLNGNSYFLGAGGQLYKDPQGSQSYVVDVKPNLGWLSNYIKPNSGYQNPKLTGDWSLYVDNTLVETHKSTVTDNGEQIPGDGNLVIKVPSRDSKSLIVVFKFVDDNGKVGYIYGVRGLTIRAW